MNIIKKILYPIIVVVTATGCGYRIHTDAKSRIYLADIKYTYHSPFIAKLKQNPHVVISPNANSFLKIIDHNVSQKCLTTSSDDMVREYQLIVAIKFQFSKDNNCYPIKTIIRKEIMIVNNHDVLSANRNENLLLSDMYSQIAQDLVDYITSKSV